MAYQHTLRLLGKKIGLNLNPVNYQLEVADASTFNIGDSIGTFTAGATVLDIQGDILILDNDIGPLTPGDYVVAFNSNVATHNFVSWVDPTLTLDSVTSLANGMIVFQPEGPGAGIITNIAGNDLTIGSFQGVEFNNAPSDITTYSVFSTVVSYTAFEDTVIPLSGGTDMLITQIVLANPSVDLSGTSLNEVIASSAPMGSGVQVLYVPNTNGTDFLTGPTTAIATTLTTAMSLFQPGMGQLDTSVDTLYVQVITPAGTAATADMYVYGMVLTP